MHRSRGLSLVELLIVMAIIAGLVAILIPAIQMAREAARCSRCKSNLRQIGVALSSYQSAHGSFPAGGIGDGNPKGNSRDHFFDSVGWSWSWQVRLLPFLDETALYDQLAPERNSLQQVRDTNVGLLRTTIPVFRCTSDDGSPLNEMRPLDASGTNPVAVGRSNYVGCTGTGQYAPWPDSSNSSYLKPNGVFDFNRTIRSTDIKDGLSKTFAVGERRSGHTGDPDYSTDWHIGAIWAGVSSPLGWEPDGQSAVMGGTHIGLGGNGTWYNHPDEFGWQMLGFSGRHSGGVNFLFCDGSVHFIGYDINQSIDYATRFDYETYGVYQLLSVIDDGRTVFDE